MIYTYEYDLTYLPAMPSAKITIGRATAEPSIELQAIIDSGADTTMVPVA